MAQLFLNNFETTFIAPVKDAPTTGTPETELDYGILRISDGAAGTLINPGSGDYYVLTAFKRSGTVESAIEVMRVTAVDNSTPGECRITVLRAQEGTTAKAYVSGDRLALRLTAGATNNWVQGDDARLTNSRTPTGPAGGVLSGTYPNPGFAVDMATQAELDAHVAAGSGAHAASAISNTPAGNISATNVQTAINELDSEKEPVIASGTTSQYWRGDKTWQALDKAAVGLGNVDNTSDADKPISAATQAALDGKENTIPAGTTSQYWRGDKSWRDFFTDVLAATLTGFSTATNAVVVAADTVLAALGKLQAQITSLGTSKQDTLVSGTNIKTLNGQPLLGSGDLNLNAGITTLSYDTRGDLRTMTAQTGDVALVDGLGLYRFVAGSDEPDDDESCFATSTGRWLLEAVHWDVVDAWQHPNDDARDVWDEDEPLRFASSFASSFASRVLHGSAACAITTVNATSSVSFTGTVTGASVGDRVIATPPGQLGSDAANTGRLSYHAWVSATNTVTVLLTNASAAAATTNSAIQTAWPVTVIKNV